MKDRVIVFDLDFTLWDAGGTWCDQLTPPFRRRGRDVEDAQGRCVRLYGDVPAILDACDGRGFAVALASRTHEPAWAGEILDLLGLRERFAFREIYPGEKTRHFQAIRRRSGVPYERMVFFDDEYRNIRDVSALGVRAVPVPDGLTWRLFERAVTEAP